MKKIVFVILLCNSIHLANAQNEALTFDENHFIYLGLQGGIGNYYTPSYSIDLNYVYKCKYSAKLLYSEIDSKPKDYPNDHRPFKQGLDPTENLRTLELLVGRVFNLNKAGTIRANLSAGVGYAIYRKAVYERWDFSLNNYPWHYEDRHPITFILNPKIEFPLTKGWGLVISPMVKINNQRVFFGIEFGTIVGLLRARKYYYYDKAIELSK